MTDKKKEEGIRLTNSETRDLLAEIRTIGPLKGFAFMMAVTDITELIEKEQKRLSDNVKFSEDYEEKYQADVRKEHEKHAKKDAAGNAKLMLEPHPSGKGQIQTFAPDPENEDELCIAVAKVKKKHKVLVDEQEVKDKEYQSAMKEFSTFKKLDILEKQIVKDINVDQGRVVRKILNIKKQ